jgi:hypothetical protein
MQSVSLEGAIHDTLLSTWIQQQFPLMSARSAGEESDGKNRPVMGRPSKVML